DAAAFTPWAIEASLLLVRLQTPANPDTSADLAALDHALAAMPAWPITARLKHMRPTRPSRD
ncbi:MAG: hypothetical protein L0H70_02440, partial [Xanthomonadales bacterium]|nr:hypothetical protein [Xanthomonadales bacterium]